jgi:hypothetical protein
MNPSVAEYSDHLDSDEEKIEEVDWFFFFLVII